MKNLAFDIYGTLIDTSGVLDRLQSLVGDRAAAMTDLWRAKQLEYSFRRGLMQNYVDFSVCTRQALDFSCQSLGVEISELDREELLNSYRRLPAFADVLPALEQLQGPEYRLFAFSNGRADDVRRLLMHAKIDHFFTGVVSCDELMSFKPNPAVYAHFLRRADCTGGDAWLISGNPFDVLGALSAGMRAIWVRRSPTAVFDPWGLEPSASVQLLTELPGALAG